MVRPPPVLPDSGLFLGTLVEYLQDHWGVPEKMPMVYHKKVRQPQQYDGEEQDGQEGKEELGTDRSLLCWDSPLSPEPDATRLTLEVVGVFTDNDNDDNEAQNAASPSRPSRQLTPPLALVVVTKHKSPPSLPPLLQGLFEDSEKRLLRHLERSLQDFSRGTLEFFDTTTTGSSRRLQQQSPAAAWKEAQHDMWDEMRQWQSVDNVDDTSAHNAFAVDDNKAATAASLPSVGSSRNAPTSVPGRPTSSVAAAAAAAATAIDAELVRSPHPLREEVPPSAKAAKDSSLSRNEPSSSTPSGLDYAVQAAKRAAAVREMRRKDRASSTGEAEPTPKEEGTEDFAVQAAAEIAAALVRRRSSSSSTKNDRGSKSAAISSVSPPRPSPAGSAEGNVEDSTNNDSLPSEIDLANLRPPMLDPRNAPPRAFVTSVSTPGEYRRQKAEGTKSIETAAPEPSLQSAAVDAASILPRINVRTESSYTPSLLDPPVVDLAPPQAVADEQFQATQEVLDELASRTGDLTPEELLRSVLRFGDDQDRDSQVGQGFVTGALETAKDLLRERARKTPQGDEGGSAQRPNSRPQPLEADLTTDVESDRVGFKEFSNNPDDEIRRMFEAGERLAENRISLATSSGSGGSVAATLAADDESQIDELIASERSISDHGRVLDDELTELELRINKSPEEHMDGPRRASAIFDILSGPETYNPNVDAETAVNWPGALPGTRKRKLPKELAEAVKQAQFAANVLTNLSERTISSPDGSKSVQYLCGDRVLTHEQVDKMQIVVKEAVETGIIEDPLLIVAERSRLQMLLDELWHQPEERVRDIASSYKDLFLSENFVGLVKERLSDMADRDIAALQADDDSLEEKHARERALLGQLVAYTQLLLKETRALGAELEAQQLEVIRSICKVAMDPRHTTEEDTAMALADAVRDMRPLFDDGFVAYLKYAVAEEEGRLARAGILDDMDHNQWLFVLKMVQQGVYKELERGISRFIDHIWYILRMETPYERRMLLQKLIDVMPSLDVRPFVQVVENIVGSLGDSNGGGIAAELGELTTKLLQLRRDVHELLPPDRIAIISRDADEWAAKQKNRLMELRKETQKRLDAARQTEHLDGDVEALGRRGELERIE